MWVPKMANVLHFPGFQVGQFVRRQLQKTSRISFPDLFLKPRRGNWRAVFWGWTMKIERVEALPLTAKMKPLRIATTTFTECRALLVRITTADGHDGDRGEPGPVTRQGDQTPRRRYARPARPGEQTPGCGRALGDMFSAMRTRGHTKGHFVEAFSGVDMALWDIIGKAPGLPLYHALHGFGRKTLPAYASSIFMGESKRWKPRPRGFSTWDITP